MNAARLPAGYRLVGTLDFVHNRKLMLKVNGAALVIAILMVAGGLIVRPFGPCWQLLKDHWYAWLAILAMLLAYIILHELTHGIFMHAISGVRPQYGFQLCYAYAGSRVWFDRRSHIVIALAPLVIWGVILQVLCAVLPEAWFWPVWMVQISNVSGSVGDVYCAVYLARLPGEILIQDTGTRMRIMAKRINQTIEDTEK